MTTENEDVVGNQRDISYRGPSVITRQELTSIHQGVAVLNTKMDQLLQDRAETNKRIDTIDDRVKTLEIERAKGDGKGAVWERVLNIILSVGIAVIGTMHFGGK